MKNSCGKIEIANFCFYDETGDLTIPMAALQSSKFIVITCHSELGEMERNEKEKVDCGMWNVKKRTMLK